MLSRVIQPVITSVRGLAMRFHGSLFQLQELGGASFNPASLFTGGYKGFWLDFSDLSTMFQDTSAATPVTATGDPIGRVNDKSGNASNFHQGTAGNRPAYDLSGGLHCAIFDGVNDGMATPANVDFSGTDKVTVFMAVKKNSDAANSMIVEHSTNSQAANGTFSVWGNIAASQQEYGPYLNGTAGTFYQERTYTAPITNVISVVFDIAGAARVNEIVTRVNGATPSTRVAGGSASAGTGNFISSVAQLSTRLRLSGNIYQILVVGKACTAGEITATEQYMAGKSGLSF